MKCLKCGKDIPNGAAFCPWCGETVRKTAPQTGKVPDDIRLDALKRAAARAAEKQAQQSEKIPPASGPVSAKPQPRPAAQPAANPQAQSQKPQAKKSPFWGMVWRSTFLSLSVYLMFNGMLVPGIILLLITIAVITSR